MGRLYTFFFDNFFKCSFAKMFFYKSGVTSIKTETLEVKLPEKGRCFDVQIPGAKQEHGKEKTEKDQ